MAAAPSVMPLFRLTVRMLLPLPGSSGHLMEQIPMSKPAAAMAGISTQDLMVVAGLARAMTWLNANPTARARGASAIAKAVRRYDNWGDGQCSGAASCVTGDATATARLEVISAVPTARGCHVLSMIAVANSAPPTGTL